MSFVLYRPLPIYREVCASKVGFTVHTVLCLLLPDVHPDDHADHLCEPERFSVPRLALHAQGLRGPLPP